MSTVIAQLLCIMPFDYLKDLYSIVYNLIKYEV